MSVQSKRSFIPPGVPWLDEQLLQFDGALVTTGTVHSCGFTALAGPGGPTPTGGGGILAIIARARRLGYTINTGFTPQSIDVPVRFYDPGKYRNWPLAGVLNGSGETHTVERQISMLEWMWGVGALYDDGVPATGDIPTVQVTSFDAAGTRTRLMPDGWRSDQDAPGALRWQVSNVAYGVAMRNENADRWFLDAVVSLTQQVATPGDLVPTAARQRARGSSGVPAKHVSTAALNTVAKICVKYGRVSHAAQLAVLTYNQQKVAGSKLKGKGLHTILKPGTVVYLPAVGSTSKPHKKQKKR